MFQIEFSSKAVKFLKKSDQAQRILSKIELLKDEPVPHGAKSIVGEKRTFRIRVGDYRVLYEVNWEDNIILIANIDKRSRVY